MGSSGGPSRASQDCPSRRQKGEAWIHRLCPAGIKRGPWVWTPPTLMAGTCEHGQLPQVSHRREASGEKVNSLRPQGSRRVAHSVRSCLHEPGRSLREIDLGSSGVRAEAKRIGSGSDRGLPHHQCVSISLSLVPSLDCVHLPDSQTGLSTW